MDGQLIKHLDKRGNWKKLPKYRSDEKPEFIHIPDKTLMSLCLQPCSVNMNKFNVLTRISSAYEKECKNANKTPNKDVLLKLFIDKGLNVYNKFYAPRLLWFAEQQLFLRFLRQKAFIYKMNAKEEHISDTQPLPETEDFMCSIASLPKNCQSSQKKDEILPNVPGSLMPNGSQEFSQELLDLSLNTSTPESHRLFIKNLERDIGYFDSS